MKPRSLFLVAICAIISLAHSESTLEILSNWRNPEIRWKDIPATEALNQLSLFAPKDSKGNSIFKYKLDALYPEKGFKDPPITYSSNQELFWDTAGGIAAAANWKMTITEDGIWHFSDAPSWDSAIKTEQGAAANP